MEDEAVVRVPAPLDPLLILGSDLQPSPPRPLPQPQPPTSALPPQRPLPQTQQTMLLPQVEDGGHKTLTLLRKDTSKPTTGLFPRPSIEQLHGPTEASKGSGTAEGAPSTANFTPWRKDSSTCESTSTSFEAERGDGGGSVALNLTTSSLGATGRERDRLSISESLFHRESNASVVTDINNNPHSQPQPPPSTFGASGTKDLRLENPRPLGSASSRIRTNVSTLHTVATPTTRQRSLNSNSAVTPAFSSPRARASRTTSLGRKLSGAPSQNKESQVAEWMSSPQSVKRSGSILLVGGPSEANPFKMPKLAPPPVANLSVELPATARARMSARTKHIRGTSPPPEETADGRVASRYFPGRSYYGGVYYVPKMPQLLDRKLTAIQVQAVRTSNNYLASLEEAESNTNGRLGSGGVARGGKATRAERKQKKAKELGWLASAFATGEEEDSEESEDDEWW